MAVRDLKQASGVRFPLPQMDPAAWSVSVHTFRAGGPQRGVEVLGFWIEQVL